MSNPNRATVPPFIILLLFSSVFNYPVRVQSFNGRLDPLRDFKPYLGGYDIRNKHYWASTAFMGVFGYAIAGVWMLFGLAFGSYLIFRNFNGGLSSLAVHPSSYFIAMFSLIALFSLLAIVLSSLIMAANRGSFYRSRKLIETVLSAGSDAIQTMKNVTRVLDNMKTLLEPYESNTCGVLNHTTYELRSDSLTIQNFIIGSKHSSHQAIEALYIANLGFAALNLVTLVTGFVLLFLHWNPGFIIIIFCCWILATLSWVLTGFDFFFHSFADDTCKAFKDFEQNPQNGSLSSTLPSCSDSSHSQRTMVEVGITVHKFISEFNAKIAFMVHEFEPNEQNDRFFKVQGICDPFSIAPNYSYNPRTCPEDSLEISDLPKLISTFTCDDQNGTQDCKTSGRFLPQSSSIMASAYSESIQSLIDIYPDLLSLTNCSPVKNTISNISLHQCKPLRASVNMLWSCMLSLSVVMVLLTLMWVAKAYQEKGRHFSQCSISPMPSRENS